MLINGLALWALPAISVPILVHLRKNKKSEIVDWAAMRFLNESVEVRKKGLKHEHFLTLFCRCMIVLFLVLAFAGISTTYENLTVGVLFPSLLTLGTLFLVWSIVERSSRNICLPLGLMAAICYSLSILFLFFWDEQQPIKKQKAVDVAIVLDTSSTMQVAGEKSNFQEAASWLEDQLSSLPEESTIRLIRSAPIARVLTPIPQRDYQSILKIIDGLEGIPGSNQLDKALSIAQGQLTSGKNERKLLLIISDNQKNHWQEILRKSSTGPKSKTTDSVSKIAKIFELPSSIDDLEIRALETKETVVTPNQPVQWQVKVRNNGSKIRRGTKVDFYIDDQKMSTKTVDVLVPTEEKTLFFDSSFPKAGRFSVSIKIDGVDDFYENNAKHEIFDVHQEVPVLIVDGASADPVAKRNATYLDLVLNTAVFHGEHSEEQSKRSKKFLVKRVSLQNFSTISKFDSKFKVVILSQIPRLNSEQKKSIEDFVSKGGGLWVLPGPSLDTDFYNRWKLNNGEFFFPKRIEGSENFSEPQLLDFDSPKDPVIKEMIESGKHDLDLVQIRNALKFRDQKPLLGKIKNRQSRNLNQQLSVDNLLVLSNGQTILTGRKLGQGYVLLSGFGFDPDSSNFISRLSFPVWVYRWVIRLSKIHSFGNSFFQKQSVVMGFNEEATGFKNGQSISVIGPNGNKYKSSFLKEGSLGKLKVNEPLLPGKYFGSRDAGGVESAVPLFSVAIDPKEFKLDTIPIEELKKRLKRSGFQDVMKKGEAGTDLSGRPPMIDLWRYFFFAAIAFIILETLSIKFVELRRKPIQDPADSFSATTFATGRPSSGERTTSILQPEDIYREFVGAEGGLDP